MQAWAAGDPGVMLSDINVAGEGQFVAGSNVVDNLDGTWTYNYAIFNNNSDFSGQSLSVPFGANVTVSSAGMSFISFWASDGCVRLIIIATTRSCCA